VVVDGLKPTLLGVAIGWVGSLALNGVVANLIFGVKASDPSTFAAVSALLVLVALVACIVFCLPCHEGGTSEGLAR
jgi:hypothetical protein